MLLKLGFSGQWVKWMMFCVTSIQYWVRFTNKLVGPIISKWDLRQGDPLFPYLFLFCVEGLLTLIQEAKRRGCLHGCWVSRGAPSISHLLFANDAFLFFRASIDESKTMKHIRTVYEEASSQAINFNKSGIMCSNNVAPELFNVVSFILGVFNLINIGRYLRLPSLPGRRRKRLYLLTLEIVYG